MNAHSKALYRAVTFGRPDFIPMTFHINAACWHHYDQDALFDLMEAHKLLFPDFTRPSTPFVPEYALCARKDAPYTDDFGCVWSTSDDGITGTVTGHPIKSWEAFAAYRAPDPETCMGIGPMDWAREAQNVRSRKDAGEFVVAGLRHGHTFLQLCDLRGYENLLYDMMDEDPRLDALIALVEEFNASIVKKYVDMGVDMINYAEDLGMQFGPMLSPAHFKKYIKPSYKRLMRRALDAGLFVQMHSDGDIRALADGLVDSGVQVLNLQDLVNGVRWIAGKYKGKLCIELDIDRQSVTPFGTPAQVDALIRDEVRALANPAGGLMMVYGLYPGVPLPNVAALMDAMERYAVL